MNKLQQKIGKTEARLITDASNIEYLSHFTGTNGTILLTNKKTFFFTDARYTRVAQKVIPKNMGLIVTSSFFEEIQKILKKEKIRTLIFEAGDFTIQRHKIFKEKLHGIKLKPDVHFVERFRIVKSQEEIRFITRSQRINEQVFQAVIKHLRAGKTEKQVAWEIEKTGRELGADNISFEPIVGFGSNSGSPHHQSSNRKLKKGDLVLIDMGMKYKGYCSDMTRTMFTQKPTQKQAVIYNTVLKAQETTIHGLKANMQGGAADKIARDIISKAGYGPLFSHSLGHGIGLQVHEAPSLSTGYGKPLPENTVVTVEPGIYLEKSFGVRIEDMVLIKRKKAENLTRIPKKIEDAILSIS